MNQIIINTNKFKTKAALLEDGKVMEVHIEREGEGTLNGNIYKGKVSNVILGMESAFINIGLEKNAFLYINDLKEFEDSDENKKSHSIEHLISAGDEVIVQILTDPRDNKGARVTTHCTIPGKFLVLVPNNNHIAISKKIENLEERERLKQIFTEITPKGMGVIIRTAAENRDISYLKKEIQYLEKKWNEVENKISNSKVGDILYKDSGIVNKVLRDMINSNIDEIVVDDKSVYNKIVEYTSTFNDKNSNLKVTFFNKNKDIFDEYKIETEIEKALEETFYLECGGSIVIQKTEALVSIDVNTGKNIGVTNLEETVVKTNLEAAKEIARQLRIRNLSGIIIIDFIDMKVEEDKKLILNCLERHLQKDRIRTDIVHFTNLGLIEMTRKRTGKPLSYYFQERCQFCNGTGKIKGSRAIVEHIIKELKELKEEKDISKITIYTKKEVKEKIDRIYLEFINCLLLSYGKTLEIVIKDIDDDYKLILER